MAVQVRLLAEAAVAQVTLERFLLVVDVANVALKIGWDAERAVTVFTPAKREEKKWAWMKEWKQKRGENIISKAYNLEN